MGTDDACQLRCPARPERRTSRRQSQRGHRKGSAAQRLTRLVPSSRPYSTRTTRPRPAFTKGSSGVPRLENTGPVTLRYRANAWSLGSHQGFLPPPERTRLSQRLSRRRGGTSETSTGSSRPRRARKNCTTRCWRCIQTGSILDGRCGVLRTLRSRRVRSGSSSGSPEVSSCRRNVF